MTQDAHDDGVGARRWSQRFDVGRYQQDATGLLANERTHLGEQRGVVASQEFNDVVDVVGVWLELLLVELVEPAFGDQREWKTRSEICERLTHRWTVALDASRGRVLEPA